MPQKDDLIYRADIDGLRGLSILFVVIYHAFPNYFTGGFIGVDIFFVISGFLITRIIMSDLASRRFNLITFYSRRIRRIFPSLIILLFFVFGFGWFFLLSTEYADLGKNIVAGSMFVTNILSWHEAGYFDLLSEYKPLLHLWSLSIEEQFYLLWPAILVLSHKKNVTLVAAIFFTCVSFVINILYVKTSPVSIFYLPWGRFWELFVGGLIPILINEENYLKIRAKIPQCRKKLLVLFSFDLLNSLPNITSIFGFTLLLISLILINKSSVYPGILALLPVVGSSLLIISGPTSWVNYYLLNNRLLVSVGLISYPLYLWHWSILSFSKIIGIDLVDLKNTFACILLSVIFSYLSYNFIEKPIRFGKLKNSLKTSSIIFAMILVSICGFVTYSFNGFKSRNELIESNIERLQWPDLYAHTSECITTYGQIFAQYCLIANPKKSPELVILGDSVANHLYPGIMKSADHQNVMMIGQGGCPPLIGVSVRLAEGELNCQNTLIPALEIIKSQPSVNLVIISMMGGGYVNSKRTLQSGFVDLHPVLSSNQQTKEIILEEGLRKTLAFLAAVNKKVLIVIGPPRLNFDPSSCLALRPYTPFTDKNQFNCRMDKEEYITDIINYRSTIMNVVKDYSNTNVYDMEDLFCNNKYCNVIINGSIMYRDSLHLSLEGSYVVGKIINSKYINNFNGKMD